jgi:hypothetical protein
VKPGYPTDRVSMDLGCWQEKGINQVFWFGFGFLKANP